MVDILLAHSYFLNQDPAEQRVLRVYPPLGILYLSAYLKARGFQVEVFDSTFRTKQEFRILLQKRRPPVVGISCNLVTRANVLDLIRDAKSVGARVVVGGPEPALHASEFMAQGADVVVRGEGEGTLAELLSNTEDVSGVESIVYRDAEGGTVATRPRPFIGNLDSLPFPDRESIDLRPYLNAWSRRHGMSSVSLITARGCPYTCAWCSRSVYGETHRRRSPQNVADEVEWIRDRYGPDALWYADDVFTIHHGWIRQYAAELKRRNLRFPFECISRADRINAEIADTLQEMGCFRLWIGSESGSQKVLDLMDRGVTVEQVQQSCRLLRKRGIQVGMFLMLGYEGEGEDDLQATVEHLKTCNPDLFLSTVAYPIKGTPYHDSVASRLYTDLAWDQRTDRDWKIQGRHSRRYYWFVTHWMRGEFELHRQRTAHGRSLAKTAKAFAHAHVGRLGMALTRNEKEITDHGPEGQ